MASMKISRALLLALLATIPTFAQTRSPHKIFMVDKTVEQSTTTPGFFGSLNTSSSESHLAPQLMSIFNKRCPDVVAFTMDPAAAEFTLTPNHGGSTLSNQKGDVVYISPAYLPLHMINDVCKYLRRH